MFINKLRLFSLIGAGSIIFASCDKMPGGGPKKTENGLEYDLLDDSAGTAAKLGDFITLHITYKTEKDSVLNSTHTMGRPITSKVGPPMFKGSFEEGLLLLSKEILPTSGFQAIPSLKVNRQSKGLSFCLLVQKLNMRSV